MANNTALYELSNHVFALEESILCLSLPKREDGLGNSQVVDLIMENAHSHPQAATSENANVLTAVRACEEEL